uniref:ParA family protein n=1 Tax=Myxosarcina sp. GI1 TaxID=1541065 RepID=UPI0005669F7D
IDLDQNHSIEEFVGTEPQQDPTKTSLALFDSNFKGDYPFISPILGTDKIGLIQGHSDIEHLKEVLSKKRRREYILQKIFSSYPLNFDLIIIDLPGGYDILTENVVVASTDILIPLIKELLLKLLYRQPTIKLVRSPIKFKGQWL